MNSHTTRRAFLAGMPAAAGMAASNARSASRVVGANDRINAAFIATGGRNSGHLRWAHQYGLETKRIQVVASSDVFKKRNERSKAAAKLGDADVYVDYRDLLARNDVDVVFIGSPDHWHARMAIDAMAAGKDVYLEKPMTLTIPEARAVRDAAQKYARILQVGSQHLSDPRHHKARELIEAGEIGDLLWAQGTYSRNSVAGEWNYAIDPEGTPETIDWKRWLGSAPKRPFSPERYFRWRKYWDYSGGIATDLFFHKLGPLAYAMGAQLPARVTGSGGIYVQKDREVPDTYATVIEYPNFYINLSSSMANAAAGKYFPEVIYGHKGTIAFEGARVAVYPEAKVGQGEAKFFETSRGDLSVWHRENFLESVRSRKPAVFNPELGYQVMVAIKLGVDSYREGKVKHWDAEADRELSSPARRPAYEGDGKNHGGERRRV
jgi:predicted dehydrogenase